MFTTIITDCKSENAKARQITRFNSFGLGPTTLIGINSGLGITATIEAGANLIDLLDASGGKRGVVVVNVAPRGDKNDGENGTSFSYFYYKKTLVISTIKGHSLTFVKKFGITNSVKVLNTKRVLDFALKKNLVTKKQSFQVANTQFRSFDFIPFVAKWLLDGQKLPNNLLPIASSLLPGTVWCIDAFGNAKLTLLHQDVISASSGKLKKVKTNLGTFPFYPRLKDVPKGKTAIYIGSSGIGNKRFLEIATQGVPKTAVKTLNLAVGTNIEIL